MMKRFGISLSIIAFAIAMTFGADGFYCDGSKLMDANGNEFIMRGCNYSYAWQPGHEYSVIPAAKRIGCNAVRIQLTRGGKWPKNRAEDIERLIGLCEENKLVCILNTHDETGSKKIEDLMKSVDYWIEMKDVMNAHRKTVILNITNEWEQGHKPEDYANWRDGYLQAIPKLREAGILNTIMVDAAGYGQGPKCFDLYGEEVANADPLHNIMFSTHLYQHAAPMYTKEGGLDSVTTKQSIDWTMKPGVPAVIGEFSYFHQGEHVDYQTIMDYCQEKGVGFLVWSWTHNGGRAKECDMFSDYNDEPGNWLPNGVLTVKGRNGIEATSKECSVFEN